MQAGRSLGVTVVGLGQCGGEMACSFSDRGYGAIAINTSRSDLATHDRLPVQSRVYIGTDGRDGTGKDAALGTQAVEAHSAAIRAAVESIAAPRDILLLCGGLGGGTGAALPALARVLLATGKPVLLVAVLPAADEPGTVKVNAARAAGQLVSAGAHGLMTLWAEDLGDLGPAPATPVGSTSASFVQAFDELNRMAARTDLQSLRTFDGEDLRRVLLAGRFVTFGHRDLEPGTTLRRESIVRSFERIARGCDSFVSGHGSERASFVAVSIFASPTVLAATPSRNFEDALADIRERTGGAALYTGLYAHVSPRTRISVVASGMPIPDALHEFTRGAREEANQFVRKLEAPAARLDVNPLRGFSLFGAGARGSLPQGQ